MYLLPVIPKALAGTLSGRFVVGYRGKAVVYTGFCVWGGGPGSLGGTFFIGEIKNFAFFQTRKFSTNAKNQ